MGLDDGAGGSADEPTVATFLFGPADAGPAPAAAPPATAPDPPAPTTPGPATPAAVAPAAATTPATAEPAPATPTPGADPVPDGGTATDRPTGAAPERTAEVAPDGHRPDGPAEPGPAVPGPADASDASDDDGSTAAVRADTPAPSPAIPDPTSGPDVEATQVIHRPDTPAPAAVPPAGPTTAAAPASSADPAAPADATGDEPPTDLLPVAGAAGTDGARAGGRRPRRARRALLAVAALLGIVALLYVGDLVMSSGTVARGVLVAGVPVGGLPVGDAERELRSELEQRTTRPVPVTVGEARGEIDPATAGLSVDWPGTLDRAGAQPLNPITRITSFFTTRDVGIATATDREALDPALAALSPIVDRPPAEGSVRFEGTTPVAVDPVPGQQLDVPAAAEVVQREWVTGGPVALPLTVLPPATTTEDVASAIEDVAAPAVSGPVTVAGEGGVEAAITPEVVATVLGFRAEPDGRLVPEINVPAVTEALAPQLASSEKRGRDAALDFSSGRPVITPSQDGRGVDYDATLKDLQQVLARTGDRRITAVYADQPAELTTDELKGLGITGVIGEFTTRGFAEDSGRNIKRAAAAIDGTIVQPGKTFSLNGATEPRSAARGYVEAGIINDGSPSRGVGGGVSQVATTLYNAAYFAGMVDVTHQEHSFYIARYPTGREATVFSGAIDLKFRNDGPTGVLIQTAWTPQSITVRLYGTKRYEVSSTTGPRTKPTSPTEVSIPDGKPCNPSQGGPGFTVTDTRTLREISTGKVRNETRTVKYNPAPIVKCGDDDLSGPMRRAPQFVPSAHQR